MIPPHDRTEGDEHATSIRAIPTSLLPDGEARQELLRLAQAGCEVYSYVPVPTDINKPVIYIGPVYAAWDGRMSCQDWQRVYALATSFPSDDEAVATLTRRYRALWATRQAAGAHGAFIRPAGLDDMEWALSFLRWRMLLTDDGATRFCAAVAAGSW